MKRVLRRLGYRLFGGAAALVMLLGSVVAQAAVTVESDLVYGTAVNYAGSNVSLTLDAYFVTGTETNRPVIILAHGGGFGAGDKGYTAAQGNFYPDLAAGFATNGFVAFSINYRLWPGCPGGCSEEIDMAVEDVMTALSWIRAQSAYYGIDATKVLIGGDSAGGGLAVNAAYRSTNVNSFLGCISIWGGVPPYGNNVHPVNTTPITAETPPTCLIHGTADTVVPYAISAILSSNLTTAAVYNELHPLAGYNHYPVMGSNVYDTNLVGTIVSHMLAFAWRMTGHPSPTRPVRLGDQLLQVTNGKVVFDLTGPTNSVVAVEESTDQMNTWQATTTNQLFDGAVWVTNPAAAGMQFYRARVVSP